MEFAECNKCGKCKEICPSYKIFLNESFSPRGRIKLIESFKEENLPESKTMKERIFSCLLCGSCESKCPLQVNIPFFIYETRDKISKNFLSFLFKYFSLHPELFFSTAKILDNFKFIKPLIKKQKLLPMSFFDKLSLFKTKGRNRNSLKIFNKIRPNGRIALFLGCSTNFLMPSISDALIEILSKANIEVVLPRQNCCGAPLLGAGFKKDMINLARKNIETYKAFKIDGVVTPCPTCGHFLNSVYKELIGENINIIQLSDLIKNVEISNPLKSNKKIFFHISCHSSNYIGESENIFKLLRKSGFNIEKKEGCCGFAGLFSFLFEKESMDILRKKVLEYEKADMIISSCPNCLIQFKFAMQNKTIMHYAEFIGKNILKGDKNG